MAAYGGLNHVQFLTSGEIAVRPVIMPAERIAELNAHIMLFYTGIKRTASDDCRHLCQRHESRGAANSAFSWTW